MDTRAKNSFAETAGPSNAGLPRSARHCEERFELALEAISDGVWDWNLRTGRVYRSPQYYELVGRDPREDSGYSDFFISTVHADDRPQVLETIDAHKAGSVSSIDVSYRVNGPVGNPNWLRLRGRTIEWDGNGVPCRAIGTLSDITEIKRMEAMLRESEASLRESQLIANIGSYVLDIPSMDWSSSAALDRLFGIDQHYAHTLEGWLELIHPDDREMMESYFSDEVLGKLRPFNKEYRVVNWVGQQVRWVHGMGVLELDGHGRPLRMRGVIQDATERVTVMQRLEQSHAQLRSMSANLEIVREEERLSIAREVHDELGQALVSIRLGLAKLRTAFEPNQQNLIRQVDCMELALAEAKHSVRRILRELRPKIHDTHELLEAIRREVTAFSQRAGIRCNFVASPGKVTCAQDVKNHIYRIFQEAMTNIARHAGATRVDVRLEHDEGQLRLTVEDNGIGLDSESLTGNTLGLAGMQERASLIGGTLDIIARPVVDGLRISLSVPLNQNGGGNR